MKNEKNFLIRQVEIIFLTRKIKGAKQKRQELIRQVDELFLLKQQRQLKFS